MKTLSIKGIDAQMNDAMVNVNRPKPRRSQEERSASSRASLIESAIRHLLRRGLASTNMTEIAAEANLTRGAIQHHFTSRAELVVAVVEELDGRICRALDGFSLPASVKGQERVAALLDHVIALTASDDNIAVFDVWSASRADPALKERTLAMQRQLTVQFKEFWRRNLDGYLASELIEISFDITLVMAQGAAMGHLLNEPPDRIKRTLTEAKAMLLAFVDARR